MEISTTSVQKKAVTLDAFAINHWTKGKAPTLSISIFITKTKEPVSCLATSVMVATTTDFRHWLVARAYVNLDPASAVHVANRVLTPVLIAITTSPQHTITTNTVSVAVSLRTRAAAETITCLRPCRSANRNARIKQHCLLMFGPLNHRSAIIKLSMATVPIVSPDTTSITLRANVCHSHIPVVVVTKTILSI
jgi:hypothetical protein